MKGIYLESIPIPQTVLLSRKFRNWTVEQLLREEAIFFREAFAEIPFLVLESSQLSNSIDRLDVVFAQSPYQGKPWEEYVSENTVLKRGNGFLPLMLLHKQGTFIMGEGLWPINAPSREIFP